MPSGTTPPMGIGPLCGTCITGIQAPHCGGALHIGAPGPHVGPPSTLPLDDAPVAPTLDDAPPVPPLVDAPPTPVELLLTTPELACAELCSPAPPPEPSEVAGTPPAHPPPTAKTRNNGTEIQRCFAIV